MREVLGDELERAVDHRTMAGKNTSRRSSAQGPRATEVGAQAAAAPARDHDGGPAREHIAREELARLGVPETDVVECVAGRVDDVQTGHRRGSSGRLKAACQSPPRPVAAFQNSATGQRARSAGTPLAVIGMAMRDEHAGKRTAAKRARDRVNVCWRRPHRHR